MGWIQTIALKKEKLTETENNSESDGKIHTGDKAEERSGNEPRSQIF